MKRLYVFMSLFILEILFAVLVCFYTKTFLVIPFLIYSISFVALGGLFFTYRNYKSWGKIISSIVVIIVTCIASFVFVENGIASSNLFSSFKYSSVERENHLNPEYSKVKKGKISGWLYSPYELENNKLVVYFGDINEPSESAIRHSKRMKTHNLQSNLLCINYPGYGTSRQIQTEKTFYSMATASIDYAIEELNVLKENIIVVGYGFGTACAIYASSSRDIEELVLISPFGDYWQVATSGMIGIEKCVVFPVFGTGINTYLVKAHTTLIVSPDDIYYNKKRIEKFKTRFELVDCFELNEVGHYEYWSNDDMLDILNNIVKISKEHTYEI